MTGRKNRISKGVVGGIRPCHTSKDTIGSMKLFEASSEPKVVFFGGGVLIVLDEKGFLKSSS